MELIQRSFPDPTTIVATDTNQYLSHLPAEFDTSHISPGTLLKEISNPFIDESLRTGVILRMAIGPERFGIPFLLTCNPIIDQGKVVGLLMTTTSTNKIESLRKMSSELVATVEQMNATTEEVAKVSNVMAEKVQKISGESKLISKNKVETVYCKPV